MEYEKFKKEVNDAAGSDWPKTLTHALYSKALRRDQITVTNALASSLGEAEHAWNEVVYTKFQTVSRTLRYLFQTDRPREYELIRNTTLENIDDNFKAICVNHADDTMQIFCKIGKDIFVKNEHTWELLEDGYIWKDYTTLKRNPAGLCIILYEDISLDESSQLDIKLGNCSLAANYD